MEKDSKEDLVALKMIMGKADIKTSSSSNNKKDDVGASLLDKAFKHFFKKNDKFYEGEGYN